VLPITSRADETKEKQFSEKIRGERFSWIRLQKQNLKGKKPNANKIDLTLFVTLFAIFEWDWTHFGRVYLYWRPANSVTV